MRVGHIGVLSIALLAQFNLGGQTFRVAGKVVDDANRPLSRALIKLAREDDPASELTQFTDGAGLFAFNAGPGNFSLTAERNGIIETFGAQTPSSQLGSAVIVGAGLDTSSLLFRWFRPSVIFGAATDRKGEPVSGALVQLMRSTLRNGRWRTVNVSFRYTDELGEYRFSGLPAGTYFLAVTGQPWYSNADMLLTYSSTFYPEADDASAARPLTLAVGAEARADFSLAPISAVVLKIACTECDRGPKKVSVLQEGPGGTQIVVRQTSFVGPLGGVAIPPGRYVVEVSSADAPSSLLARASIEAKAPETEVKLQLRRQASIIGTLRLESGGAKPGLKVAVSLILVDGRRSASALAGSDGTFRLPAVAATKFRVTLSSGYYPKEVSAEGAEYREGFLFVPEAGEIGLHIVAADDVARVRGVATVDGKPRMGALVVLAPATMSADELAYRAYQTESDGSFDLDSVRPGEYFLFAVADTDLEYANPAVIRGYAALARKIVLERRGNREDTVQVIDAVKQ